MRRAARIGLVLWFVFGAAAAAAADKVYRCGSGNYQSTPCPGGMQIDAADTRTPEQQRDAEAAARHEAALAARMSAERLQQERRTAGAHAGRLGAAASAAPPPASASKTRRPPRRHQTRPPADPRMSPPMRAPAASAAKP